MNPAIRVVSKSDNSAHNMEKLKKAGADEIVACHDVGTRMMIDKGLADRCSRFRFTAVLVERIISPDDSYVDSL